MRETFTIAAVALLCIGAISSPPVTFESPCECRDNHGKHRWSVKIDPSTPPADASAIQAVKAGGVSVQSPAERKGGIRIAGAASRILLATRGRLRRRECDGLL
jgi:hypothetical protein